MMNRQMDMFREGGLNQEGGMVDAESGNKVPVGSTRKEVRDDISAKLSEGEFVMPADVVRYHGLDKMMALRDEAKMGLRKMDAMGQMGNSEESTLPEEMPFGMADLIVVAEDGKEVEMAEGGYVTMANGGDPSSNVRQLGPQYTAPTNQPIDFKKVMGDGGISFKEYRNAEGKNLLVAFVGAVPLYPIPEGYTEYTAGADEPVTPIQEFVQQSPPTPQPNEERDGPNYIEGYSLDMATASTAQLENELRKQTSGIGKLASGIAFALGGPLVAGVFETGKSASANKLAVEIQRRLDTGLIPPNKVQSLTAQLAEMKKNVGFGLAPKLAEYGRKAAEILGIDLTKDSLFTKVFNSLGPDPSGQTGQKIHKDNKTSTTFTRPLRRPDANTVSPTPADFDPEGVVAREKAIANNINLDATRDRMRNQNALIPPVADPRGPNQIPVSRRPFPATSSTGLDMASPTPADFDPEGVVAREKAIANNSSVAPYGGQEFPLLDSIPESFLFGGGKTFPGLRGREGFRPSFIPPVNISKEYIQALENQYETLSGIKRVPDPETPGGLSGDSGELGSLFDIARNPNSIGGLLSYGYGDPEDYDRDLKEFKEGNYLDDFVKYSDPKLNKENSEYYRGSLEDYVGELEERINNLNNLRSDTSAALRGGNNLTNAALRGGYDANRELREKGRLVPGIDTASLNANNSGIDSSIYTGMGLEDLNYNQYSKGIPTPSTGTQPVGTKMLRNVGGTSGRQNVITQDMFPPMTYNTQPYDERNESVYGAGVKVNPATNFVQNNRMMYNRPADTGNYSVNTFVDQPQTFPSEMESILQSGVQTPVPPLQAGASDFNQDSFNSLMGTQPTLTTGTDPRDQIPDSGMGGAIDDNSGVSEIGSGGVDFDSGGDFLGEFGGSGIDVSSMIDGDSGVTEADSGMGRAIQDQQQRRKKSTLGQMTTPKFNPSSTVGQMTTPKFDPSSTVGQMTTPQYQPSVAAKAATAASIYDKSFGAGAQILTGIPQVEDQVYDVRDSKQRAAANKALNIATSPGTAGTGPQAHILSSGRKVPINSAVAQYDRDQVATGYTGTDAEQNVTGKISGVDGLAGVVKSGVGNKAAKVAGKTVYKDSSGKAYTNSTFGSKVEVQLVNGKWSNKTVDGKSVKYSKGTGVSSGHGTQNEQDNSSDKEESKIICTAMNASYGFGSYRQAVWLNYSNKHLTKEHEVGYHTLFLPLVHLAYTKDNKLIRKLLEHGTRRRTADIRAELKGTKRNTLGRIYRAVLEPLCYGVGKIKMTLGE